MKKTLFVSLLLCYLLIFSSQAFPCSTENTTEIKGQNNLAVFYKLSSENIQAGSPFSLSFTVCDDQRVVDNISQLKFDAKMPAHGHGMNYSPDIKNPEPGYYSVDSLLLHMPGTWQFSFDISYGSNRQTLTFDYTL